MKKYSIILAAIFSFLQINSANSQESELVIIEEESKKDKEKSKTAEFLKKSISGSISYSQLLGSEDNKRSYTAANLRFDHKFYDRLRIVADGIFEKVDIQFKQNLHNTATNLPESRTLKYSREKGRVNEGYLALDLNKNFTVSGGMKIITWGQFEPFSPTNFAFPLNVSATSTRFSKVNSTMPQPFLGLEVFPSSKMSLEAYYMPRMNVDDLTQKEVNSGGTRSSIASENLDGGDVNSLNFGSSNFRHNDGWEKEDQFAARVMFYPSWGSFGISYFDGYDATFSGNFGKLQALKNSNGSNFAFSNNGTGNLSGLLAGDNYFAPSVSTGLSEQKMIGIEAAVPVNKFTFKFELAKFEKQFTLKDYDQESNASVYSHVLNGRAAPINYTGDYNAAQEYVNWIYNNNGGNFYFPYDQYIGAIGFDADLDRWLVNFAIFGIHEVVSSEQQNIINLQKEAFPNITQDNDPETEFFPMLNIGRYTSSDKSGIFGVTAGVIGNGTGAAIYYNKEFRESINLGVALVTIEYFSDDVIEDTEGGTINYEKAETESNGILFSLGYKF